MTPVGYSGTPLPKKLGIKPRSRLLLVDTPADLDIDAVLAPLPDNVGVHTRAGQAPYDVIVVFTPDSAALARRFAALQGRLTAAGALWVAWPKRASKLRTDLDENVVRDHGLAQGLVDTKVCAVTDVWSGLRFVRRLVDR